MDGGAVVWLTGRPGAGKTTIAERVVAELARRGTAHLWLDSDVLRAVLTPAATYDDADRDGFYRALGVIAALAARGGVVVVVSATAPKRVYRDDVRRDVARFVEVFVTASDGALRARDPKGLYARAARGEVVRLPGVGAPYEAPDRPEVVLDTEQCTIDDCAAHVLARLEARAAHGP
ncbi:adenylyl-sulfate kinase [Myxococcota bacterium]|nr:adenylyl-sulfate kinase [Myxococcota bacterium]